MFNKPFSVTESAAKTCGVVTLANYMAMPDGQVYDRVFCSRWEVVSDPQMPVDGFHSQARWTLAAVANNTVVALFPGCQVKAWCLSGYNPSPAFYNFDLGRAGR